MSDQTISRDTIFALASGGLPAGIAVVRVSGERSRAALKAMTGMVPEPRRARLSTIRDQNGMVLDKGLVLFFPGPESFTGEDCGELHLHGGRAVVASVLETLGAIPGLRGAEPGEFTKRAFLNGKVDLTGAEALADLIAAETEAQRRFALENAEGRHRTLYEGWRRRLIAVRALIEAELDFADEGDVPGSVADCVWHDVERLKREIADHATTYRAAEIVREGFRVVILGAPNAGKSSLLNALTQRDVAIVTEEPGTTRDVLEVALDIGGVKVVLTDTAGIRTDPGRIEAIGIKRAMSRAQEADLVVLLEDLTAPAALEPPAGVPALRIGNKLDLISERPSTGEYEVVISAKTGKGIPKLLQILGTLAARHVPRAGELVPFRARHLELLHECQEHLGRALGMTEAGLELRAEELRLGADALGRIAGTIEVEDLLDTIFSQFCIGK